MREPAPSFWYGELHLFFVFLCLCFEFVLAMSFLLGEVGVRGGAVQPGRVLLESRLLCVFLSTCRVGLTGRSGFLCVLLSKCASQIPLCFTE